MWIHAENGRKQRSESSCLHDSARKKAKRETKKEMDGLRPKGYALTYWKKAKKKTFLLSRLPGTLSPGRYVSYDTKATSCRRAAV